jgi:peptidoglycan hydrolase-like protein with peptidoglycan-binding domain
MSLSFSPLARRVVLEGGLVVTAAGLLGVPAVASRRGSAPAIAGTEAWRARPPSGPIEVRNAKPNKIIVHHTALDNTTDFSPGHAYEMSRQIQNLHMDVNRWVDTGQNFTNSRGGWLTEGRNQSLAALNSGARMVVGTHAGDAQNPVSVGIENEGTYMTVDVPDLLWRSLVQLCAYIATQYGIPPGEIYGHRDFMTTQCPGDVLYGRLGQLREEVAAQTGGKVMPVPTWPLLREDTTGPRVEAAQHLLRAQGASTVPVDGLFGSATQRAAEDFLAAHGLRGCSCTATRAAEPGLFGGTAWAVLAPVLTGDAFGEAVRAAQVLLAWRGHSTGASARFDRPTTAAVRDFQAASGLSATGVIDHRTWKRLLA